MFLTTILLRKQSTFVIKEKCECYLLLENIKKNGDNSRCINNILFELSRLKTPCKPKLNSCVYGEVDSINRKEGRVEDRTTSMATVVDMTKVNIEEENSQKLDSYYFRDKNK